MVLDKLLYFSVPVYLSVKCRFSYRDGKKRYQSWEVLESLPVLMVMNKFLLL